MKDSKPNNFQLTWLPKKTFEILATIPWSEIEKAKKKAIFEAGKTMEIKGFRKGKAPEKMVLENLSSGKLLQLTLQELIPDYYQKAISNFGLSPILTPKAELVSAKENEDWQVKFTSCEEPQINLGNYKEELRKLKSVGLIWTPEKGTPKPSSDSVSKPEEKEGKLEKIIQHLEQTIKIEVSDLLIEAEVNRKLAELLDQIQKLGLTLEQYLSSTGKTVDSLKQEYKNQAEKTLRLQFLLSRISEAEKIEVTPAEIEKAISSAKNEEEKKALESQKYLLASLIRQQKTLDFLANL